MQGLLQMDDYVGQVSLALVTSSAFLIDRSLQANMLLRTYSEYDLSIDMNIVPR